MGAEAQLTLEMIDEAVLRLKEVAIPFSQWSSYMTDNSFVYTHRDCNTQTELEQDAKAQGSVYCPKCMMFRPQHEFDKVTASAPHKEERNGKTVP